MKTFTHDFMLKNCGCYSEEKLMGCSFMSNAFSTIFAAISAFAATDATNIKKKLESYLYSLLN